MIYAYFFAGMAAGMAFIVLVVMAILTFGRRMTREQREANNRVNGLLADANAYRCRIADGLAALNKPPAGPQTEGVPVDKKGRRVQ